MPCIGLTHARVCVCVCMYVCVCVRAHTHTHTLHPRTWSNGAPAHSDHIRCREEEDLGQMPYVAFGIGEHGFFGREGRSAARQHHCHHWQRQQDNHDEVGRKDGTADSDR